MMKFSTLDIWYPYYSTWYIQESGLFHHVMFSSYGHPNNFRISKEVYVYGESGKVIAMFNFKSYLEPKRIELTKLVIK